jgi:proline iminopeptidase
MRARLNGVELFFEVDGYGLRRRAASLKPKPVMAVLHGGPGFDHSDWVPWLKPLTRDIQLLYVDHRGNGRSSRPPVEICTPDVMADDLERLRLHLGIERLVVFGASFGGMVALSYAVRHPGALSKLILSSTAASHAFVDEARRLAKQRGTPEQIEAVMPILNGTLRDEAHLAAAWPVARPLYYFEYDPRLDASGAATIRNVDLLNWFFSRGIRDYDLRSRLDEVETPTLVLCGRHDFICPPSQAQELSDGLRHASLVTFERSGHLPHKEQAAEFRAAVRHFVLDA